jgi:hypothetical protein
MKTYWGSGGIVPHTFLTSAVYWGELSFTSRSLYPWGKSSRKSMNKVFFLSPRTGLGAMERSEESLHLSVRQALSLVTILAVLNLDQSTYKPMPHLNTYGYKRSVRNRARIAQWYSPELRAGWSGVRVGAGNSSPHHRLQAGCGAHLASYLMGTRGTFPEAKVTGVWNWPLTSI